MAISFKIMNAFSAMEKLGVDPELLKWLKESPIVVMLKVTGFEFAPQSGEVVAQPVKLKVNLDDLQKLKAGTLSSVQAATYKNFLNAQIQSMQQQWATQAAFNSAPASVSAQSPLAAFPKIKSDQPEPAVTAAGSWPMFDLSKLKSAPTVKLRDATMMYQPVQGTTAGSRYFVIGANKDIRVAARYKDSSLSVRVEGPFWQKYIANLQQVGFDKIQQKEGYASTHLDCGADKSMASKALGAVLIGLGVPLDTPIPQLGVIAG